jgi:hypothetical protein
MKTVTGSSTRCHTFPSSASALSSLLRLLDGVEKHPLAFFVDGHRLVEEDLLVGHAIVERPGVLGETQSRVLALLLREVDGVHLGVRDRHGRVLWIDVDRRHVEVDVRIRRDQVELGNPADLDPECRLEGELDPIGVMTLLERDGVGPFDLEQRRARVIRDGEGERKSHPAAGREHAVVGADDPGADDVALAPQHGLLPADEPGSALFGLRTEEGEGALAAAQVRNAHAAQQEPVLEGNRREGDRDALNDGEDVLLAQELPEVLALLQQLHARLVERDEVAPDVQDLLGAADVRRAEHGLVAARVPGEEVVDAVVAGVDARGEGGPRHRRHRGHARVEGAEDPAFGQLLEVGQAAFAHEPGGQPRIHPVQAENHDPPGRRVLVGIAHLDDSVEEPDGPGEDDGEGEGERDQQDQHRPAQGEPRPRTDVGVSVRGTECDQKDRNGCGQPASKGVHGLAWVSAFMVSLGSPGWDGSRVRVGRLRLVGLDLRAIAGSARIGQLALRECSELRGPGTANPTVRSDALGLPRPVAAG